MTLMSGIAGPPIKITSVIILGVALFVAVMYLYEPLQTKREVSKLSSLGPDADEAVEYLAQKDKSVEDFLVEAIPERPGAFRWNALRILEKRGSLNRMPETLVLNYMAVKNFFTKNEIDPVNYKWTVEDYCNGFFVDFKDLLGGKYIGAALISDNECAGRSWTDMLDHEWILGKHLLRMKEFRGFKCVGDGRYLKKLEDVMVKFDSDNEWHITINEVYLESNLEWVGERSCFKILRNDILELIVDDFEKEFVEQVPHDARLVYFGLLNLSETEWAPILFTLCGFDLEFRDKKIYLKTPLK